MPKRTTQEQARRLVNDPAPKAERTLQSIIRQAETLRPKSEAEDGQMYYLIGGIIANAEDALGALRSERETANLMGMLRNGITMSGRGI